MFKHITKILCRTAILILPLISCSNMLNNHPIDNRILYASIKSYIYKVNIENDIPITYSLDNTLFSKVTDAVQMRFRNEDPAWTTFVNYSSTNPWILPPGYGNKVVYAEFMDSEGNYHQLSDDIFYIEMLTPVEDDDLKGLAVGGAHSMMEIPQPAGPLNRAI